MLFSAQGQLYDEPRPQGRPLCSPDTPRVEEISSFPVKGNNLRVPLPPIRLSLAPRVFTRTLHPIATKLRPEGIRTVVYLDDLLLIDHQNDILSEIFLYVRRLLSSLGFKGKLEMCSREPTHRLVFLGAILDTTCMSAALPEEQIDRIQGAR